MLFIPLKRLSEGMKVESNHSLNIDSRYESPGFLVAAIAGIMVYISFDELLPSSHSTGHHHTAVSGVIAGMAIMAISLMIL